METVADFSGGKGRAPGLPGPRSRPGAPSRPGCSGPSRAGRNGSSRMRREAWVRAIRPVGSSPSGLGCSSGAEGPGVSGLGHLVGPPATGPKSPVLEVARSACGPPRALPWYLPHWWWGWHHLALLSALGGVKALAERRPWALWGWGEETLLPGRTRAAVLLQAVGGADCWPPSGTIADVTRPRLRELCSREGGTGPRAGLGGRPSASSQL